LLVLCPRQADTGERAAVAALPSGPFPGEPAGFWEALTFVLRGWKGTAAASPMREAAVAGSGAVWFGAAFGDEVLGPGFSFSCQGRRRGVWSC